MDRRQRGWARRTRARKVRVAAVVALCAALVPGAAVGAPDPERHDATPTGWGWHTSVPPGTVADFLDQNGMRLIDLEVTKKSPARFGTAMVSNSGPFARAWWWYYDKTFKQVRRLLRGRRLIDLESYLVSGKRRYAAVMVANTGPDAKKWWWYVNATPSLIKSKIKQHGARIVDIDPRAPGRYSVVLLRNKGEDRMPWWYYYRATVSFIKKKVAQHNARLVDIEPDGNNRYTVVMTRSKGEYWWWHNALTAKQVTDLHLQIGMRIYDVERYRNPKGKVRFAVLLLNNLDEAGTRARQALWEVAGRATFGFYLKQVDGPVLQWILADTVFEPASMIKALHHVTAMKAVKDGDASVDEIIPWYAKPDDPDTADDESANGGICAYEDDGTPITTDLRRDKLSVVLSGMMKQSDNRHTDAIYNRFGHDPINATADALGMTKTELNHRPGCPRAAALVDADNELTLEDDGRLFEAVARGSNPYLGTGVERDQFYAYMASGLGFFKDVVNEEAAALGMPEVAEAFRAAMKGAFKPGGYRNGVAGKCDQMTCTQALMRNTGGGWVALPFKTRLGATTYTSYVYGAFFDGVFDCAPGMGQNWCTEYDTILPEARAAAYAEMLRPHIRAALETW